LSVKLKVVLGVGTNNVVGTRISVCDVVGTGVKVDDIDFLEVEDRVRAIVVLDEEEEEDPTLREEDKDAGFEE